VVVGRDAPSMATRAVGVPRCALEEGEGRRRTEQLTTRLLWLQLCIRSYACAKPGPAVGTDIAKSYGRDRASLSIAAAPSSQEVFRSA
jgi:hypothetical protein